MITLKTSALTLILLVLSTQANAGTMTGFIIGRATAPSGSSSSGASIGGSTILDPVFMTWREAGVRTVAPFVNYNECVERLNFMYVAISYPIYPRCVDVPRKLCVQVGGKPCR